MQECKLIVFSDIMLFCEEKKAEKLNVVYYINNDQVVAHKQEGESYEIHTMHGTVKIKKTAKSNTGIFQMFEEYFYNEEIANEGFFFFKYFVSFVLFAWLTYFLSFKKKKAMFQTERQLE